MSLKLPINLEDKSLTIPYAEIMQADAVYSEALDKVSQAEQAIADTTTRADAKEAELKKAIDEQAALILKLGEELKNAPIFSTTRKPTISKTELLNVAGVAIPKGNAPSAAQDQNARDLMLLSSMMGFNAWRGFFNQQEVKAHVAMAENNINHLPGYGRRLGLTVVFDTLNNPAVNYSDSDLKIYLEGLRKMAGNGPFVGYFDDANQYRDELKYPKGTLERLIGRIRQFAPDLILIASLTANAITNDYKPPFDFVEAQTFGKITELPIFLDRSFDVYCLDGRKEISVDYLTKSIEVITSANPPNVFYYITGIADWKTIPDKLPIIKQVVTRWMSMAR